MSDLPPPPPPPPPGAFTGPGYAPQQQREWAGFWIRFAAGLIDGIILAVPGFIISLVLSDTGRLGFGYAPGVDPLVFLVQTLMGLAYYAYQEGSPSGQTIGKKLCGIRVIDVDTGASIGVGRAAGRYLGSLISGYACGLGYFWMLWDDQRQTWHDKMVRSNVVKV